MSSRSWRPIIPRRGRGALLLTGLLLTGSSAAHAEPVGLDLGTTRRLPFTLREFQPDVKWSGRVNAIAVHPSDPQRLTVTTETGGLFQSDDAGETWRHVNGLPVFDTISVAYHPDDPRVLLVTSGRDYKTPNGAGIWRSVDGGATWAQADISTMPSSAPCEPYAAAWGIAFEPDTGVVYVATSCGMARSSDAGETWTRQTVPGTTRSVFHSVVALGEGRVVGAGFHGVYWSEDGAESWTPARGRITSVDGYHAMARSPRMADGLYAVDRARDVHFSGDGGESWLRIEGPPTGADNCGGWPFVKVTEGPRRDVLHVGNRCGLYTGSIARPWIAAEMDHGDTRDLALVDGVPTYLATDGGFHRPGPDGAWVSVGGGRRGLNALQLYEVTGQQIGLPRRHDLYIGTQDNNLWSTDDGGRTWPYSQRWEGFYIQLLRTVRAAFESMVLYTSCGACWTNLSEAHFRRPTNFRDATSMAHGDYNKGYAVVAEGVYVQAGRESVDGNDSLYVTETYGEDWRLIAPIPESIGSPPHVASRFALGEVVYIAVHRGADDRGAVYGLVRHTGIRRGTPSQRYPAMRGHLGLGARGFSAGFAFQRVFAVDPADPMHLIAPDPRDGDDVKESWDGGETWTSIPGVRDLVTRGGRLATPGGTRSLVSAVAFHPENASLVMIGGREGGVYFSHDRGRTFEQVPGSERIPNVTAFHWKSLNEIYVSSYGRGLWKVTTTYEAPAPSFVKICGEACRLADVWQPDPRPPVGPIDFDRAMLVFDGRILDARVENGRLTHIGVTAGSAWILSEGAPKPRAATATGEAPKDDEEPVFEIDEPGEFKGLEAARKLMDQGWVIRGFTLVDGAVRDVIVGREEAQVEGPGPLVPFVDTGEPESGILKRASVTADYDASLGLLRIKGFRFGPWRAVEVRIDGERLKRRIRAHRDGGFVVRVRRPMFPGLHEVRAREADGPGGRFDAIEFTVGTADGERERHERGKGR